MLRNLTKAIACLMFFSLPDARQARADDIVEWLAEKYDCRYAIPLAEVSPDAANQVGSILLAPSTRSSALRWASVPSCAPIEPTSFTFGSGVDTKDFSYKLDAGASITAKVEGLFDLASFNLTYLDEVKFNLIDVGSAAPAGNRLSPIIEKYWADNLYCKPKVLCGVGKTVAVTAACQAKVDIQFHFKATASLSLVNAVISKLKLTLGANLHYNVERGQDGTFIKITSNNKPVIVGLTTSSVWNITSNKCHD